MWSLAVVCSEILSGEIPFDSMQCRRMTMEHFVDALANDFRPPIPNNINTRLRSAVWPYHRYISLRYVLHSLYLQIYEAWQYSVDSRCSASDLWQHFDQYLKERLKNDSNSSNQENKEGKRKTSGDDSRISVTNGVVDEEHL